MNDHDLLTALQRELDELARTRDELRVRIHLAKADAKDEWHKLEEAFARVSAELARSAEDAKRSAGPIGSAARTLLDDLRLSYERIKGELRI